MCERATKRAEDLTPPRGPWACESNALEEAANIGMARMRALPEGFWLDDEDEEDDKPRDYAVLDGIVTLSLSGPLMKRESFWSWLFGGCGMARTKERLLAAGEDPMVSGVMLVIDSPGGTVDGTADLADAVAAVNRRKPVHGFADGMACSAAFWVLSQCGQTSCGRAAMVGCIGTYATLEDWSKAAEKAGVKVHVQKAGALKGAGVMGAPVTKDQIDAQQRLVNGLNEHFLSAVASGRRVPIDTVREWATGETFTGDAAQRMGLVDRIGAFDDDMGRLKAAVARRKPTMTAPYGAGGKSMDVLARIRALANGADDEGNPINPPANPAANPAANLAANPAANAQSEAAAQVVALNAQMTALTTQVSALNQQVQALTSERDALKATADEYTQQVRAAAFSECVRALGPERARAEEDRILGSVVMGEDNKPTGQRTGGLALPDAKTIRDTYKAAADARYGIASDQGGKRSTTVTKLPDIEVHAEDAEPRRKPRSASAIYEERRKAVAGKAA